MHYTTSSSQHEILNSITDMYLKNTPFYLDTCYNKGGFYTGRSRIAAPVIKNDLNISGPGLTSFDVRSMPLASETVPSVIFDPPFLIGNPDYKMIKRYGGFKTAPEMFSFQDAALSEISRVLVKGGWLVTKVQDFSHGRQKYFTSVYQVNKGRDYGLDLIDSFILVNRNRLRNKGAGVLSAVSSHCFFHVFQKVTRKKRISRY